MSGNAQSEAIRLELEASLKRQIAAYERQDVAIATFLRSVIETLRYTTSNLEQMHNALTQTPRPNDSSQTQNPQTNLQPQPDPPGDEGR